MKNIPVVLLAFLVMLCSCYTPYETLSSQPQEDYKSSSKKEASYQFSIAFSGNSYSKELQQVAANIERRTSGDLKLIIFSDNQMGTDSEIISCVQKGTLSMTAASTALFQSLVPEAAVINIPACYTQYVQPYVFYDGEFYNQLNSQFHKAGFELLVEESSGYRLLTSAFPITSIEQLENLQIRTLKNRFHARLWELLGAVPFENIEWRELYYALQEGVVEAQDNPLEVIRMGQIQDIHPYALNGPFFVTYNSVVMNKESYDSLPVEYQVILKEELTTVFSDDISRLRKNPIEIYGLTINTLTQSDQNKLKELLSPMLEEIEQEAGSELMNALIVENQVKKLVN